VAVDVARLGVVFSTGQVGAQGLGHDEVAVLGHRRLHLGVAGDPQADPLRHHEIGVLTQVLNAVDEFAGEAFANERGSRFDFERDDLVALRRHRETGLGLALDDEVVAPEFVSLSVEFEREGATLEQGVELGGFPFLDEADSLLDLRAESL